MSGARMTRCVVTAPDGRRCLRPTHGPDRKHLIAMPGAMSLDLGVTIGIAWGYPESLARRAAEGALSARAVSADHFVTVTAMMVNAVLDADDERARRP